MNQEFENKRKILADSVGDFIKYWGFKEIHGKVWLTIYLSDTPITAKELTNHLGVTKGLISTALAELIAYRVINKVSLGDARSPGYTSSQDLLEVILSILQNRELKLTTKIEENIVALSKEVSPQNTEMDEKIEKLRQMTHFAVESLNKLLNQKAISTDKLRIIMRLVS